MNLSECRKIEIICRINYARAGKRRNFTMSFSDLKPPTTSRGVQNTIMIDWLSFTVPLGVDVFALIGIGPELFRDTGHGAMGYKHLYVYDNIKVYTAGTSDAMGIHVEMSGKGVRQFESTYNASPWVFFAEVHSLKGRFTRLDIAYDDFQYLVDLDLIKTKINQGLYRTRFKSVRLSQELSTSDNKKIGETIYFGSPSSSTLLRIYDKALESNRSGEFPHWVRMELQLRSENANNFALQCLKPNAKVGEVYASVIKNYLVFINDNGDSNKSRWPIADFWRDVIGSVDKMQITKKPISRTLEDVKEWIEKQIIPSLVLLSVDKELNIRDLSWICNMIIESVKRLNNKHLDILAKS